MNQDDKHRGQQIRRKRKDERLSAEDLARKLGLKKENIYKWEKGSKPQDPEEFEKIMNWLNNLENIPRGIEQQQPIRTEQLDPLILAQAVLNLTESNKTLANNNDRLVTLLESNLGGNGKAS